MFKALEIGNKIKKSEFNRLETLLRRQLLQAQFELRANNCPVVLIIGGLDGAGKGALAQRLNEWMDPRGIETNTFWEPSDEEESRPYYWRFWRQLPARGSIGIFLGSWYTAPMQSCTDDAMDAQQLASTCSQIKQFERLLAQDGTLIIKVWLHVSCEAQRLQLSEQAPRRQQNPRITDHPYEIRGNYQKTLAAAESFIRGTDTCATPWKLIEAQDRYYRDINAGAHILATMREKLQRDTSQLTTAQEETDAPSLSDTNDGNLSAVDLGRVLERDSYKRKLNNYQARLQDLSWQAYRQKRSVVAVFEGWDAAGKGSAIRRVTSAIDPRLYKLVQFAAPSDEERAHHYLWRFWRRLQRDGRATFFDRSWYGRVLVERVEGFATNNEWQRAYSEINQFEQQLVEHGCIVLKFWLHISHEEQLKRFKARELEPHKRHKITAEDWRNRGKWHEYEAAVEDMLAQTSTEQAPWTLVAGNDKRYARIQILKTLCTALEQAMD